MMTMPEFFGGVFLVILSWSLSYFVTERKFWRTRRFLKLTQVDSQLGAVEKRFNNASEEVCISGNDCKFIVEVKSAKIEQLLAREVKVKILVVDPDSTAPDMLAEIDPGFDTPEDFRSSMVTVIKVLQKMKEKYPKYFEYKLLPILPAIGFFIVDRNDEKGIVKVEINTAKRWSPIDSRPHLVITRKDKEWRNYFLTQWDRYWNLGRNLV